ncbi:hypothetical protein [Paludisphaera mucosa]|uniref:Uncharacterized protein n=1 Tax=Paludisphaera mucosa TaxID=3030827 RepID=A0ABT6F7R7_9BACT|nr:hypothetical protein [Paludisphaera mucosa]MDG3003484.1 hypothetical protein [Paludisphaera mucosa]
MRHVTIDSGHDYNRPMREAMYGWLDRWLRGRGDGSPVPEPEVRHEDPALLRCYPDAPSRPATIVTIPTFAHREAAARIAAVPRAPDHVQAWEAEAVAIRAALADEVLGGLPQAAPPRAKVAFDANRRLWTIEMSPEPGLSLRGFLREASLREGEVAPQGLVILSGEEDVTPESALAMGQAWVRAGYATFVVELRALGRLKPDTSEVAGAVDHNEAEWGIWIGRPLIGQWVFDLLQWIEVIGEVQARVSIGANAILAHLPLSLHGRGATGTAAILASAFAPKVTTTVAEGSLVRFVGPVPLPWSSIRMGLIAPGILKLGDVGRLASLTAPRRLVVVGGVGTDGEVLPKDQLEAAFVHARTVYGNYSADAALVLKTSLEEAGLPPER